MLVSRTYVNKKKSDTYIHFDELQNTYFRAYFDGDISLAQISLQFDTMVLEMNHKSYEVYWKQDVLYLEDEPLTIASNETIISSIPTWWPDNVVWPPNIHVFQASTRISHIVESKQLSLRDTSSWQDIFVHVDRNTHTARSCACHDDCPTCASSCYLLKNEYGIPTYRVTGRYDQLFAFTQTGYDYDTFKRISQKVLKTILKGFYVDQHCLWKKTISLEARTKQTTLKSLWLRCCIDVINNLIHDCLDFVEYHEHRHIHDKKYTRQSSLNLRSGKRIFW